jgi:hypothetical protein
MRAELAHGTFFLFSFGLRFLPYQYSTPRKKNTRSTLFPREKMKKGLQSGVSRLY